MAAHFLCPIEQAITFHTILCAYPLYLARLLEQGPHHSTCQRSLAQSSIHTGQAVEPALIWNRYPLPSTGSGLGARPAICNLFIHIRSSLLSRTQHSCLASSPHDVNVKMLTLPPLGFLTLTRNPSSFPRYLMEPFLIVAPRRNLVGGKG